MHALPMPLKASRHTFSILIIILSAHLVSAQDADDANALKEEAIALVQAQLEAYNQRDLEKFLEPYSDSIRIYNFPNDLRSTTKEALRKPYGGLFENMTDLYCELVNRTAIDNVVIDHELVTFMKGRPQIEVFAIYHIRHGKIQEVHFLRPEDRNR